MTIKDSKELPWDQLELAARNAVVAGGFAAMGYYRGALAGAHVLGAGKNPTTEADIQATLAIIRSLDPIITLIAGRSRYGHSYFAEDLRVGDSEERESEISKILDQLGGTSFRVMRTSESFIGSFDRCIAVLFDGLDGTTNFTAGIPLFCSAIAFFIGGEPRVGAIYDPHHNVVYYGSLRGEDLNMSPDGKAYMWHVQSGSNTFLPGPNKLPKELLGCHLTRSSSSKMGEFLGILQRLAPDFSGTYMLNSGQLALAYVASGNLSAFINNYTNIWDVAGGEVLVRATGGTVSDFRGSPISYKATTKVEVIAASSPDIHKKILESLNRKADDEMDKSGGA